MIASPLSAPGQIDDQRARPGDRSRHARAAAADVDHGDAVLGRPHRVRQFVIGVLQGGLVGAEQPEERILAELGFTARHGQRDLVHIAHIVQAVRPRQDRLARIRQHFREFINGRKFAGYVADQAQAHHIIDLVERVTYPRRRAGIAAPGVAPLAGVGIDIVGTGGAGAKMHPIRHDAHGVPPIAPPDGEGARGRCDRILNDVRWDADSDAVHARARRSEQVARLLVEHVDARALQAFERRLIDFDDLVIC